MYVQLSHISDLKSCTESCLFIATLLSHSIMLPSFILLPIHTKLSDIEAMHNENNITHTGLQKQWDIYSKMTSIISINVKKCWVMSILTFFQCV